MAESAPAVCSVLEDSLNCPELLPAPLRAADFIVAWRAARKLGGAIRYRMDADDGNDDIDNNDITPPLASPAILSAQGTQLPNGTCLIRKNNTRHKQVEGGREDPRSGT